MTIAETARLKKKKIQPPICAQNIVVLRNLLVAVMFPPLAFVHMIACGSQTKRPPGVVKARIQAWAPIMLKRRIALSERPYSAIAISSIVLSPIYIGI